MVERVSPPLSSTRIRMTLNSKADTVLISMAFKGQAIDMGVSKNRGTPKWMVKIMENPIKMDPFGGETHYFRKHPYVSCWAAVGNPTPRRRFCST